MYSPLSLLPPALRIDKHEQRMSALYCCDLNGEMSKQTVGVGRLQDASQEFTSETHPLRQLNTETHAALPGDAEPSDSFLQPRKIPSVSGKI